MGLRTVNLSELKGSLNKRGRGRYENSDLRALFQDLLDGKIQNIVWDELFKVTPKTTDKELTNLHAKWRNRAVSVFASLGVDTHKPSITWTSEHEMVIVLVANDGK